MKLKKWIENWDMKSLKINVKFLEMEWAPSTEDQDAAWELYVEMLTRITTQDLTPDDGDEQTALESVHQLFGLTRAILRSHGRGCVAFSKIAVVVLNQVVRPFTAKWHRASIAGAFKDPGQCKMFRSELLRLQAELCKYTAALASIADVEDLTRLEEATAGTPS